MRGCLFPGGLLRSSSGLSRLVHLQAASSHTPRIDTEVQVFFFDTDCAGVVHNIAYLRFIEIARILLAESWGMSLAAMARDQRFRS